MRLGVAAAVVEDELVPGDVEVDNGLIASVGLDSPDGSGIAVPGFIDIHTHGYLGVDFSRDDPEAIRAASAGLVSTGVTSFRPTLMSLPEESTAAALARIAAADSYGSRILDAHLEGPFLSPEHPGAHSIDHLVEPEPELIERLVVRGRIGHITIAPELDGALELIPWLVEQGIVVSIGHSDATAETAHNAFDLGASALTHVFNAVRPFRHRDPGPVGAALSREDVFVEMILDWVHLSAEAAMVAVRAAGPRLIAITDGMEAAGLGDGTYHLGDREVVVRDGEARLADGTIASSVLTMDAAFRNLLELGLDLAAAVRATSTAPARLVGRPGLGSLTPGTVADVTVLDDDHRITMTLVDGDVRFEA